MYLYRPLNASAQVLCDIVAASTGAAVMTEIELATIGSYSYMEPYWCSFDEEQGLARFVWATGTISDSSSSTPGWLYGASVSTKGLVWAGTVLPPKSAVQPLLFQLYAGDELPTLSSQPGRCSGWRFSGKF
ncbi:MAG: hypothetical protein ACLUNZ_08385 [Evtepia sp.]